MNNFDLHTPTRILFGKARLKSCVNRSRRKPYALITYGGGVKTGVLDRVLTALNGLDVAVGGIRRTRLAKP